MKVNEINETKNFFNEEEKQTQIIGKEHSHKVFSWNREKKWVIKERNRKNTSESKWKIKLFVLDEKRTFRNWMCEHGELAMVQWN